MPDDTLIRAATHLRMWAESPTAHYVALSSEAEALASRLEERAADDDERMAALIRWSSWNLGDGSWAEEMVEVYRNPRATMATLDEVEAPT